MKFRLELPQHQGLNYFWTGSVFSQFLYEAKVYLSSQAAKKARYELVRSLRRPGIPEWPQVREHLAVVEHKDPSQSAALEMRDPAEVMEILLAIEQQEVLDWLTGCPSNDVNFQAQLKKADGPTIVKALAVAAAVPTGNKTRIQALWRELGRREKAIKAAAGQPKIAPTSPHPRTKLTDRIQSLVSTPGDDAGYRQMVQAGSDAELRQALELLRAKPYNTTRIRVIESVLKKRSGVKSPKHQSIQSIDASVPTLTPELNLQPDSTDPDSSNEKGSGVWKLGDPVQFQLFTWPATGTVVQCFTNRCVDGEIVRVPYDQPGTVTVDYCCEPPGRDPLKGTMTMPESKCKRPNESVVDLFNQHIDELRQELQGLMGAHREHGWIEKYTVIRSNKNSSGVCKNGRPRKPKPATREYAYHHHCWIQAGQVKKKHLNHAQFVEVSAAIGRQRRVEEIERELRRLDGSGMG